MYAGDALFSSAHVALSYAYTYGDTQHGQAAAAERQLATFARDRYGRPPSSGRGLVGLDGAAQAGMIKAIVERLDTRTQLVAVARFAKLNPAARKAACAALAIRLRLEVPGGCRERAAVAPALLERHFGMKVNTGLLADAEDVDLRSVRRWQNDVRAWIKPIEQRAMNAIEEALEERALVSTARDMAT